jgi:hypothetical protein
MTTNFVLIHDNTQQIYGRVSFNGKFTFELDNSVDPEYWNRIGFIKLPADVRNIESLDLFAHLNARLPITLREATNEAKLRYIRENGLRVASDNFYLQEVK